MTTGEVRKKFLDFYAARGHTVIPSAPLVPANDPTTLFTSSGMQPLVPYLLGQPHPGGSRLANSQKSVRTGDIEEIGDNRHLTYFEMLGNWSLGDYFKKEQIPWVHEFLTTELKLPHDRLWVTCFEGDESLGIPKDTESADIWKSLGIPEERIYFYDAKKNWWSRSGTPAQMPAGEPGGPDTEIFYDFGQFKSDGQAAHDPAYGAECHPNCDCGRFIEIGNSVFMEYQKQADGSFAKLPQRNVDFGG
ncbi:MAG: alanine--tRNA ligase-related protein, partial [Patescibacteria group bacterium]